MRTWTSWRSFLLPVCSVVLAATLLGCQRSESSRSSGARPGPACRTQPLPFALGQFGSLVDQHEYATAPKVVPPAALTASGVPGTRPSHVTLGNLPPVSMQGTAENLGSPGSCEAQSFGYGLGAYTAARLPDGTMKWSAGDLANTPSAAFLFALGIAAGDASCPKGGLALPYLRQLIVFGSASTAQVPYKPSCCYFDDIDENRRWPGAERLRIGSFATFSIDSTQLDLMRDLLAAGNAIAFSGPVLEGYDDPQLDFGVLGSNGGIQPETKPNSGHGELVVGYNDKKGNPAAPGAFLIQNSFGTKWPQESPGGRIWWAYETFLSTQSLAAVAYPLAVTPPAGSTSLTTAGMPAAYLTAVNHWVDPSSPSDVYLILSLEFSEPVVVGSVRITQPGSTREVQQQFGEPFSNGYVFFRRVDGHQFENGAWPLRIEVTSSDDMPVTYTGLVGVIPSVPTQPSEASAIEPIYGSNGNEVMITP